MNILTLNCGSSSVKFALFATDGARFPSRGIVERVGGAGSVLSMRIEGRGESVVRQGCPDHVTAVGLVLDALTSGDAPAVPDTGAIRGVGHRVVHGGEAFARSALVTPELLREVARVAALAPLHNPPNLAGIEAASRLLPSVPHVAVFDTAFHQTMPPEAYVYALPYEWYETHGIRRYGFHGTSHLYVSARAARLLGRPAAGLKIVTLHIGNGVSAAAVAGGRCVDTTMGFTPLEGLVMGTRCGWVDPAVPLFVMEREKLGAREMDALLNKKSGLLGITGSLSDRRDILKGAAEGDARCRLALDIECRAIAKAVAALAAAMGGLDAVVFTAGVGENAPAIRERALAPLGFLGIDLDRERNLAAVGGKREERISTAESRVAVLVVPTNEELVIAEDTWAIVEGRFDSPGFRYSFV